MVLESRSAVHEKKTSLSPRCARQAANSAVLREAVPRLVTGPAAAPPSPPAASSGWVSGIATRHGSGKDDDVARCNNVDDCPDDLEDNRYRYQCVYGEDQAPNSEKVCVADFEEVNCHPDAYANDSTHPFPLAYADATDNQSKALYVACTMENLGKQGCGYSIDFPCPQGLSDAGDGICDDTDPATPKAIAPNKVDENVEAAGQDVLDQFCGETRRFLPSLLAPIRIVHSAARGRLRRPANQHSA
jgi:hypothetical protein